jgi:tellurite resistance protein
MSHVPPEDTNEINLEIYFRLLAAVAAADGHIPQEEFEKIESLVVLAGGEKAQVAMLCREAEGSTDFPLWFLHQAIHIPPRSFLKDCVRDAYLLATVGSTSGRRSLLLVRQAADLLGLSTYLARMEELSAPVKVIALPQSNERPPIDVVDEILNRANASPFDKVPGFRGSVYFRMLAAIAAADGEMPQQVLNRIAEMMELAGVGIDVSHDVCDVAMERRVEPLWFLANTQRPHPEFGKICLRDGNLLALGGGETSPAEEALLRRAAKHMGIQDFVPVLTLGGGAATQRSSETMSTALPRNDTTGRVADLDASVRVPPDQHAELDLALGYTGGVTLAAGSAYILAGGNATVAAGWLLGAAGASLGAWVVPAALLVGGGVARTMARLAEQARIADADDKDR